MSKISVMYRMADSRSRERSKNNVVISIYFKNQSYLHTWTCDQRLISPLEISLQINARRRGKIHVDTWRS